MKQRILSLGVVNLIFATLPLFAKETLPYPWPLPPDTAAIRDASALPSDSGLVVVERTCSLALRSFGADAPGVEREEFIRFLIVTDEGAKHAMIEVNGDPAAKVTVIEARTIAPDGTIQPVDEKRDIKRVDIGKLKSKEPTATLAAVNFPAPQKGMILDVHFVTVSEGVVFSHAESLVYKEIPALSTDFYVTIRGGYPGLKWSVLTIGGAHTDCRADPSTPGRMTIHLGPHVPARQEPFAPPASHRQMMLLCYLDLSPLRNVKLDQGARHQSEQAIDSYGRIGGLTFGTDAYSEYWTKLLRAEVDSDKDFLRRKGAADDLNVAAEAPESLPLEERVARLYKLAQAKTNYNPEAEDITTLSAMMKRGTRDRSHGTLLLSFLLTKAKIDHQVGIVLDRYRIRFSPIVLNEYLFRFKKVILVEAPSRTPVLMMPGEFALPFGSLPDAFQESLAFFPVPDKAPRVVRTPRDVREVDRMEYRYDLALDAVGDVAGTLVVREQGAPALDFYDTNAYREYHVGNPTKADKKMTAAEKKDEEDEFEKDMRDELLIPGQRLEVEKPHVTAFTKSPAQAFEITSSVRGKGLAQSLQNSWLLHVNPVYAGYVSPFVDERRTTPIWYRGSGKVSVDGEITLPEGAAVVDLPPSAAFTGPEGAKARCVVEKGQKKGAAVIRTHLEFDVPNIVPTEQYAAWRVFQAEIAKVAQARCVITMPAKKELE